MAFNVTKFKKLKLSCFEINAGLNKHTTFKIGGKCLAFVQVYNLKELKKILKFCLKNKIKYFILGRGSNVLFQDNGFNGIIINFSECYKSLKYKIKNKNVVINVGAGMHLTKLNLFCAQNGFSGLEWSLGIPASVGGAICSNIGSFNNSISSVIKKVKVVYIAKFFSFNIIKTKKLNLKKCNFSYRNSVFKSKKYIITQAKICLKKSDSTKVNSSMQEYLNRKKLTQPLGTYNAGCIFKNGSNYKIAQLIENLGLKGKMVGHAQISTKHSNFIVNKSKASCQNVKDLINYIKFKVQEKYKITPELEIEIIEEGDF